MRIIRLLVITLFSLTLIGCSTTTIRSSKDYQSSFNGEKQAIVLPIEAKVYEVNASGNKKELYDFEYNIENVIAEQIIPVLNNKGLRAKLLTRKDVHDQSLFEFTNRIDDRFKEEEKSLYKKESISPKEAFNITSNIGDVALVPATKNDSDIVILVRYARAIKSSGSQALGFAAAAIGYGSDPADLAKIEIAFIEAKTGKILWINRVSKIHASFFSSDNKTEENKIMKEFLTQALKEFKK